MHRPTCSRTTLGFCLLLTTVLPACADEKPAAPSAAAPASATTAKPAPTAPPTTVASPAADQPVVNLLADANGGQLIAAPFANWSAMIDGKEDSYVGVTANTEAVFAFKDEKPATFDTFAVLIPAAANENLKDFELLVGDKADGEFRSIGKFQAKNLRLMKTGGWQEFKFPAVTAKYLTVRVLSRVDGYGAGLVVYEIRLLGFMKK
jgi:hypothetical protein